MLGFDFVILGTEAWVPRLSSPAASSLDAWICCRQHRYRSPLPSLAATSLDARICHRQSRHLSQGLPSTVSAPKPQYLDCLVSPLASSVGARSCCRQTRQLGTQAQAARLRSTAVSCDLDFCCYLQHFVAMEPPKSSQKELQKRINKSTTFPTSNSHPKSSQWLPKWLQIELMFLAQGAPTPLQTSTSYPKVLKNNIK